MDNSRVEIILQSLLKLYNVSERKLLYVCTPPKYTSKDDEQMCLKLGMVGVDS